MKTGSNCVSVLYGRVYLPLDKVRNDQLLHMLTLPANADVFGFKISEN